jgi:N-acetylglucosaminyldiphosphoundecaprenol N-acetyl-beta-D-mannosaminyltransferase
LEATVMMGVGAAFDFHAGRVRQAPRWIQRSGFEWFYRMCAEPKRLWKRYLTNNPRFVIRILAQRLGLRTYPMET